MLGSRDVEERPAERGIEAGDETVRRRLEYAARPQATEERSRP
jgi:transposase-like protein